MIAHPSSLKLIKYAGVSVISTIVSQVTLFMTFGVCRVMSEVPANIVANAVATVPSYYAQPQVGVGEGRALPLLAEVVPFWVLSFIGLAFSSLGRLAGRATSLAATTYGHATTTLLVNAANLMSFAILWIVKFIIYNKLFHIDPDRVRRAPRREGGSRKTHDSD